LLNNNSEPLIIFSDGLPSNECSMRDAITIIKNNKVKTIIEMKERIVDFIVVNSMPWITGIFRLKTNAIFILKIKFKTTKKMFRRIQPQLLSY
jgi:hypothetical protein